MLDGELNAILSQVQEIATEVVAPLSGENDKLARWPETGSCSTIILRGLPF